MKKFVTTIALFVLMVYMSFSQGIEPTYEKQDDLVKATYYYDTGSIKEVGFFKDNKLHSQWISYNQEGKIKVVAVYNEGKKDGKWYLVGEETVKEVTYKSNEIVKVEEVQELELSFI